MGRNNIVRQAFDEWQQQTCRFKFIEVSNESSAQIIVQDTFPTAPKLLIIAKDSFINSINRVGQRNVTLGYTTSVIRTLLDLPLTYVNLYGSDQITIGVNSEELSTWPPSLSSVNDILRYTITHEIGHAIGIAHNFRQGAIMSSQPKFPLFTSLQSDDVSALLSKYGLRCPRMRLIYGLQEATEGQSVTVQAPFGVTEATIFLQSSTGGDISVDAIPVASIAEGQSRSVVLPIGRHDITLLLGQLSAKIVVTVVGSDLSAPPIIYAQNDSTGVQVEGTYGGWSFAPEASGTIANYEYSPSSQTFLKDKFTSHQIIRSVTLKVKRSSDNYQFCQGQKFRAIIGLSHISSSTPYNAVYLDSENVSVGVGSPETIEFRFPIALQKYYADEWNVFDLHIGSDGGPSNDCTVWYKSGFPSGWITGPHYWLNGFTVYGRQSSFGSFEPWSIWR